MAPYSPRDIVRCPQALQQVPSQDLYTLNSKLSMVTWRLALLGELRLWKPRTPGFVSMVGDIRICKN